MRITIGTKIEACHILVMDNLVQGWPYNCNIADVYATRAYQELEKAGYIQDGKVTDKGHTMLSTWDEQVRENRAKWEGTR